MAEKCYVCGVESGEAVLFDAIVGDGIVKICERCSSRENIPLIKSGQSVDIDSDKGKSNYERLSKMAGLDPNEHKSKFSSENKAKEEEKEKQNKELKKTLQERNELSFPNLNQFQPEQKEDLIRNFHWSILRARRAQGYTYNSLAKAISEDEQAVRMAERGMLPQNYHAFVRKLQFALGITLFKSPSKEKKLGFDKQTAKHTTLSDLQEKHKKMEESGDIPEELRDEVEDSEVEVERTPFWKRMMNLFKSRRRKRSEGPLEIPEEDIEKDLNLAKAQDLENSQQEVSSSGESSVSPGSSVKNAGEKVKSSLKGLKSLRMRRKQREEASRGTSPSPSQESKKGFSEKRKEYAKKKPNSEQTESQAPQRSSESEATRDSGQKSEEKKGQDSDLSEDEINKIIFGGK